MPLARQEAQAQRKPALPQFDPDARRRQIDALGAFVQANGGGPTGPPSRARRCAATTRPAAASCSGSTAPPATTSPAGAARCPPGKYAPNLDAATETQIYAAMLSGPQNMPKFSDRQLTPEEKKDIIAYVKSVTARTTTPAATRSAASARCPRA